MLCGLTRPSSGTSSVLGHPFTELPNPGRHIGVLIDASAAHSGRRGRETLAASAQLLGVSDTRIDEMLELVRLDNTAARKRVGQYSLGMRQRLGIAHALLGDPEVLILDEPANGLDPEGMRWMRGLLRDFAARGGTVLLSSHLLHEVEAIADRLVIIAGGKIVADGSRDELAGDRTATRVRSADNRGLRAELLQRSIEVSDADNGALLADGTPEAVGDAALAAGIALRELVSSRDSGLEALFFSLTGESVVEGDGAPQMHPPASPPQPVPPRPSPPIPPRQEVNR
jgi:ABC-2 type transport system ATP-binding protein